MLCGGARSLEVQEITIDLSNTAKNDHQNLSRHRIADRSDGNLQGSRMASDNMSGFSDQITQRNFSASSLPQNSYIS